MCPFLPTPYPDETVHSLIARYHIRSGNLKRIFTYRDLFDQNLRQLNINLPSNINKLLCQVSNKDITLNDLIENHTLLPFFYAFKNKKGEIAKEYMNNGNIGEITRLNGFNKGKMKVNIAFKHCSDCIKEDKELYGETYWHRVHQLPAVYFCPTHKKPLIQVKKQKMDTEDKNFILANQESIFDKSNSMLLEQEDKLVELMYRYAEEARSCILNYNRLKKIDSLSAYYRKALKDKGYTKGGRIDRKYLSQQFKSFYGEEFLDLMDSSIEYSTKGNWLFKLFNERLFTYTARHILFIIFLYGGIEQFLHLVDESNKSTFQRDEDGLNSLFGEGPWPCLNPAHNEYMNQVIKDVETKRRTKNGGHILGTFKCSCGFIYSMRPGQPNKIVKIKFGPVWEDKLRELNSQGLSQRKIAKQLGVSHSTVRNQLINLEETSKNGDARLTTLIDKRRQLLALLNNNGHFKANSALYQWLNKNDREWFRKNYRIHKKTYQSRKRINWKERDRDLLSEVRDIIINWDEREEFKPKKITKSSIAKQTKSSYNIIVHNGHDKIPNTLNFINSVAENSCQYNIRKLEWAYNVLKRENDYFTVDELVNKAGLSKNGYRLAKEYFYKS